mgnify:CR=1 FL=1
MPQITGLGHVGIYAEDLPKQRDFYSRVLGLQIADEDLENRGRGFMSADPVAEHHEFVLMKGRVTSDDAKVIQQISFKVPTIDDLRGDGDHYAAQVVSAEFEGKSRVQQHQLVYQALQGRMGNELHALALQTSAPDGA